MNENPEKIYKCKYCGQEFNNFRILANHYRHNHYLVNYVNCTICGKRFRDCDLKYHLKSCIQKHKPYYCEKCGKLVTKKFGSGRFCSRKCANSHYLSDISKKKISQSVKDNPYHIHSNRTTLNLQYFDRIKQYYKNPNKCKICGKILDYKRKNAKTCGSKECLKICSSKGGGYKEKKKYTTYGKYKNGHYKGIYCASSYELVYLIYCLDHNIPIKRFDSYLEYDGEKYYPDFIVNNEVVEIKGFKSDNYYKQLRIANKNNILVKVKFRKDLDKEFKWVKENYKYKDLSDLYDENTKFK